MNTEKRLFKNLYLLISLNLLVNLLVFTFLVQPAASYADSKVKAAGMLTSVEDDGSVVINGNGYIVSSSVRILDDEGNGVSLESLKPPLQVDFEYVYTKEGPEIRLMKIIPE